ncbi:hypothetical protein FWH13_00165 [Candidatus Saccharibacteria bacterium]|nr:hypothetical protein [Candidatus Saccharibacteria bacterium]
MLLVVAQQRLGIVDPDWGLHILDKLLEPYPAYGFLAASLTLLTMLLMRPTQGLTNKRPAAYISRYLIAIVATGAIVCLIGLSDYLPTAHQLFPQPALGSTLIFSGLVLALMSRSIRRLPGKSIGDLAPLATCMALLFIFLQIVLGS